MQQSQTDAMEGSHSCPASSGGKLGAGWQITMGILGYAHCAGLMKKVQIIHLYLAQGAL